MPTEEGIESLKKRLCNVPHWFGSRSPHPPVSTGTFSLWEKGYGILWINHDKAQRDTLRLSSQFFE